MRILIINILSLSFTPLNDENSEDFFILLSLIKKLEDIATTFANRLFSDSFLIIVNILSNHINPAKAIRDTIDSNLFAYIISNKYLSNQLHEIIIDIDISKHFAKNNK